MNEEKNTAPTEKNGGSTSEKTESDLIRRIKSVFAGKSKAKNDVIFIAALLIIAAVVGMFVLLSRDIGDTVTVTVGGELFGEYSLSENRHVEIRVGDNLNYLVIEDGKAYMKEASCPDGICVSHRSVSKEGESIVCRPNRVVVLVSVGSSDAPDTVG